MENNELSALFANQNFVHGDGKMDTREEIGQGTCIASRMKFCSFPVLYLCEGSHHEVIAYDPTINLELKKIGIKLPFVLFHKSGVADELYEFVSISMQSGIGTEIWNDF